MVLGYLTLITALVISAVAIYYSVAGLAAIFAAAVIPIVIMGVALEIGKLVTAVWLHKYWKKAAWWLRTYLSVAVVVLMFITSMGIFGFLSKAHIDQTASSGDNGLQIQLIDQKIAREQKRIKDADLVISQLDKAVQVLLDANRIRGQNGAIATRENQKEERASLNAIIQEAQTEVGKLQDEKLVLEKEQVAIEAEVGPIKYIAEFIYGSQADKNLLEEAVRWVIIVLIFVFDPLAVLLLIAAQYTFQFRQEELDDESGDRLRPVKVEDTESKEQEDDIPVEKTNVDADATIREVVPEDNGPLNDTELHPVEQPEVQTNGIAPGDIARTYTEGSVEQPAESSVEKKDTSLETVESSEPLRLTKEQLEELEENEEWQTAKEAWKVDNPNMSLKFFKGLYLEGKIDKLPWEEYLVEKKPYMMKEDNRQVRKVTTEPEYKESEDDQGYIQNEEQKSKGLWKTIRRDDE